MAKSSPITTRATRAQTDMAQHDMAQHVERLFFSVSYMFAMLSNVRLLCSGKREDCSVYCACSETSLLVEE